MDTTDIANIKWINTGLPLVYSNWAMAQPSGDTECTMMEDDEPHRWRQIDCNANLSYICEF